MSQMTDCPTCGGLLPVGKRCCPHCHCKYPTMKRWRLAAAAALSVGAAGCVDRPLGVGGASPEASQDAGTLFDASQGAPVADFSHPSEDMHRPPGGPDYGPAIVFSDLSGPVDSGAD
jgi:hypothetical protein